LNASRLIVSVSIALLLCPALAPVLAYPQHHGSIKVLSAVVEGNIIAEQLQVNGVLSSVNATFSDNRNDPVVSYEGNYAVYPTYIGNAPYSWWTGISNPPEIYVYIQPLTAINMESALTAAAVVVGGLTAIVTTPLVGAVAGPITGLLSVDYSIMYSSDHASDNSFTFWVPVDWYNADLSPYFSYSLYMATPHYWWSTGLGAYAIANR
jgi:hypothetical protein